MRALLAFAVALFAVAAPATAQDGFTFTFRETKTTSGMMASVTGAAISPAISLGRTQTQGRLMRTEYLDSLPHPPAGVGAVLIRTGERLVYLDPSKQQYYSLDSLSLERSKAQMKATGVSMRVVDPRVSVERLGADEPLLGQPTERWRMTQSMSMVMSMMGTDNAMQMETTTEITYGGASASGNDAPAPAPTSTSIPMASPLPPEYLEQLRTASRSLPARLALRTVTTSVVRRDGQEMSRTVSTTDILTMSHGPIPAESFVIPAGYREAPFPGINGPGVAKP